MTGKRSQSDHDDDDDDGDDDDGDDNDSDNSPANYDQFVFLVPSSIYTSLLASRAARERKCPSKHAIAFIATPTATCR